MTRLDSYMANLQGLIAATMLCRHTELMAMCRKLAEARAREARIFICGNGGSAATADHFACDLAKSAGDFRAIALSSQTSILTALANDIGYVSVFAAQLEALADANDVLVAISVSGDSPNVLAALRLARQWGMHTIGLLGCDGGQARELCDVSVVVPSGNYGQVEDVHLAICHAFAAYFKGEQ